MPNHLVRAGVAAVLLLGLAACDPMLPPAAVVEPEPDPRPPVVAYDTAYTVYWNNSFGPNSIADSARIVVRDSAAFAEALRERGVTQVPGPWQTDFSRFAVIIAAQGGRGTGGYGICVDSVRVHDGQATAYITRKETPGWSQAATRPMHIVRTVVRDEPITFVERVSDVLCQPSWIAQP
jgi:hypothetical protein